jgi:hypothetical protein
MKIIASWRNQRKWPGIEENSENTAWRKQALALAAS